MQVRGQSRYRGQHRVIPDGRRYFNLLKTFCYLISEIRLQHEAVEDMVYRISRVIVEADKPVPRVTTIGF